MIHSITLSPINNGNHNTLIDGKYIDKKTNQTVILTIPYGVAINRALTPNEQKWGNWFRPNQPKFTITWNDELESDKGTERFAEYLKKHGDVKCEGNTNAMPNPKFKLTDSRQADLSNVKTFKSQNAVANMIINMSASEMVEVSFFMGLNPIRKTTENILMELCDWNTGILMLNPSKFLSEWKMPDRSHIVYAKKAIALGIVKTDDGIYKLNNTTIGNKIDDVVLYFKANTDIYENFVKKEVNQNDLLPIGLNEDTCVSDVIEKKHTEKVSTYQKVSEPDKAQNKQSRKDFEREEYDKRQLLINKMKDLGIKGWHLADKGNWGIQRIEEKIKEAEKKLVAA